MAYEIGTAVGAEDLLDKMVTFLTTNATLVAANQHWDVLRYNKGNAVNLSTNMSQSNIRILDTFRYDPRNHISLDPSEATSNFRCTNYSAGNSYFTVELRVPSEVRSINIRANTHSSYTAYAPSGFNFHYSDDNSTWTLVASPSFTKPQGGAEVTVNIPASGPHKFWRVTITAGGSGANLGWYHFIMMDGAGVPVNYRGGDVILKSRGFSGAQEIFSGMRVLMSVDGSWQNIALNGYTGFNPNERSWDLQPGSIRGYGIEPVRAHPMACAWPLDIKYWFVASGNSFRFALKVSTVYESGYLGFILPYSSPGQYAYPLAVGGSTNTSTSNYLYSFVSRNRGVYCCPGSTVGSSQLDVGSSSLLLRSPEGSWLNFYNNWGNNSETESVYGPVYTVATPTGSYRSVWPHCVLTQTNRSPYRECIGGGYLFQPCVLTQYYPNMAVHGELEGTYHVSGYQVAAEDTSTISGRSHVIFQNTYRNSQHNYWSLSLE